MKNNKRKWLLWLNLIIVLPALLIWVTTAILLRDAGIYIALIFIPLIIATYMVLIIDALVGVKVLYRKLVRKA
jgi:hypothetical protein